MNRERLERLEALLRRIAKRPRKLGFDLSTWKCGTTACAVGHAAMDPWFKRQGLALRPLGHRMYIPTFDGCGDFIAVAKFFDIEERAVDELFCPYSYADEDLTNPLAVADRIRALLDGETR